MVIDQPWIDIFQRYARTENTYGKHKVMKIGGQILGVLNHPIHCSLVMDIVIEALNLNRCEEIKDVLRHNELSSLQEFHRLLEFAKEKQ